ncbi:18123_t:CDS:2 [Dentiscutata erythropus]|uniref:18123_t:CDS:1 n=1 Tax=Dentiscutata erythropus TaxID=1348616 RepID=A0A9N9I2X8_9GLOM|nr:18123_t:CDS:2 [Dentiscutata erythropus]
MTDSKKPQEQTETDLKTGDEISQQSKDKENVEDKKPIESIIEAGARTVALVDENVMMAMPELLEKSYQPQNDTSVQT